MAVGDGLALEIINVLQRNLSFRESEIPNTYFLMAFLVQTAFYVAVCVTTDAVAVFLSTAISTYACA